MELDLCLKGKHLFINRNRKTSINRTVSKNRIEKRRYFIIYMYQYTMWKLVPFISNKIKIINYFTKHLNELGILWRKARPLIWSYYSFYLIIYLCNREKYYWIYFWYNNDQLTLCFRAFGGLVFSGNYNRFSIFLYSKWRNFMNLIKLDS